MRSVVWISSLGSPMHTHLDVLLVQPDDGIGDLIADAMEASGHDVRRLSAASWAVPVVRAEPPDVVLLERRAPGFERLYGAIDGLDVHVTLIVTRLANVPGVEEWLAGAQVARLVRRIEDAALRNG